MTGFEDMAERIVAVLTDRDVGVEHPRDHDPEGCAACFVERASHYEQEYERTIDGPRPIRIGEEVPPRRVPGDCYMCQGAEAACDCAMKDML